MTILDATTAPLAADARAFVLLKSRRRLDLLNPDPAGLDRLRPRRGPFPAPHVGGGASQWSHPFSIAQHSLTVLAINEVDGPLTAHEALCELLHDRLSGQKGDRWPIVSWRPWTGQ
jgi:hypothetical protein